jgi:hypothetical protein
MYGISSANPTEHWVNQPLSNGPTDFEDYVDDKGVRGTKNPPGSDIMYIISNILKSPADIVFYHFFSHRSK